MNAPEADIQQTISDPRLQLAIYTATGRVMDLRAKVVSDEALPDYQALRDEANAIKKHTIENLDYYLEQLESNVVAHGGKVIYCRTGQEAADFVLDLAKQRGVHMLVKSKSMTTSDWKSISWKPWKQTLANTSCSSPTSALITLLLRRCISPDLTWRTF